MDYPCSKFGDFSFSRFGFIVRTDRHTQTGSDTDATNRFTPATVVDVNELKIFSLTVRLETNDKK